MNGIIDTVNAMMRQGASAVTEYLARALEAERERHEKTLADLEVERDNNRRLTDTLARLGRASSGDRARSRSRSRSRQRSEPRAPVPAPVDRYVPREYPERYPRPYPDADREQHYDSAADADRARARYLDRGQDHERDRDWHRDRDRDRDRERERDFDRERDRERYQLTQVGANDVTSLQIEQIVERSADKTLCIVNYHELLRGWIQLRGKERLSSEILRDRIPADVYVFVGTITPNVASYWKHHDVDVVYPVRYHARAYIQELVTKSRARKLVLLGDHSYTVGPNIQELAIYCWTPPTRLPRGDNTSYALLTDIFRASSGAPAQNHTDSTALWTAQLAQHELTQHESGERDAHDDAASAE